MMQGKRSLLSPAIALLVRLRTDERGATAIEYGMLVALLGVVISTAIYGLGDTIKSTLYDNIIATLAK